MALVLKVLLVFGLILLINIPFGYWRANTRRFSWQWILGVHVPVPIAIGLRLLLLGWMWLLVPVFVAAYSIGQFIGGRLRRLLAKPGTEQTSNLAMDLYKLVHPATHYAVVASDEKD